MFKWARKTAVLVQSGDQGDLDTKKRASPAARAASARANTRGTPQTRRS